MRPREFPCHFWQVLVFLTLFRFQPYFFFLFLVVIRTVAALGWLVHPHLTTSGHSVITFWLGVTTVWCDFWQGTTLAKGSDKGFDFDRFDPGLSSDGYLVWRHLLLKLLNFSSGAGFLWGGGEWRLGGYCIFLRWSHSLQAFPHSSYSRPSQIGWLV